MKIRDAQVIVTSPGRNFVTLKIDTDEGVTGLGDATLNGRELAVASYLRDHVVPLLIDRDPHRIEDTWQYLYKGAYWRRGPVTMAAIAAVDVALWDIKGKIAGLPVYQLLGGAARHAVRVYCHANGNDLPELFDSVDKQLAMGYHAVRIQSAVPGLSKVYGVAAGGASGYEPAARGGLPTEETWDSAAYLRHIPRVFEKVRERFGPELPLLHDAHHRLTPVQAARLAKDLEPYDLFWLEDVTPAEDQDALRLVRQHSTTPLAIGEVFNSVWDCEHLIRERLIDYIRTSVVHAGGISHTRRIFSLAEVYGVKTGSHGPTDVSPVTMAAAVHLDMAVPNFGIQEHMPHEP
ncbi:MAG: D-galactonate dehydratase family protein, partial [Actinobacteria bacterium]|nr:D-galactonate dehydratase family protein [Actinomycetota bacterium]